MIGSGLIFCLSLAFLSPILGIRPAHAQDNSPSLEERVERLEQAVQQLQKNREGTVTGFGAAPRSSIAAGTRSWGPEQATGEPNTHKHADLPTAWATQDPDGGEEWLELLYERGVPVQRVRVFCTFNPGAIEKVTAFTGEGREVTLWRGRQLPKNGIDVFEVSAGLSSPVSRKIKIYLDTKLKNGWNEIDAVELVSTDGTSQWAKEAAASSFYGEGRSGKALRK